MSVKYSVEVTDLYDERKVPLPVLVFNASGVHTHSTFFLGHTGVPLIHSADLGLVELSISWRRPCIALDTQQTLSALSTAATRI
jgi:hypothetical protein